MIAKLCAASLIAATLVAAKPDEDRTGDRAAIRAHIESIYEAFIHKDGDTIRATHDENWHGFLEGSRRMIRGIDDYMQSIGANAKSPYGMKAYRIRDYDILFQGDAAFVTFIAEVEANTPTGTAHITQRLADFYIKKNGSWIQGGSNTSIHPETIDQQMQQPRPLSGAIKTSLLEARESVWRAFFANDRARLEKLLPEELIAIDPAGDSFAGRASILEASASFAKSGANLTQLEFPKTEVQCYGNTAIIYGTYRYELTQGEQHKSHSGRVTETFVFRDGSWVNSGWHMDSAPIQ